LLQRVDREALTWVFGQTNKVKTETETKPDLTRPDHGQWRDSSPFTGDRLVIWLIWCV